MANIIYFAIFLLSILNIALLSLVVKNQRSFYYTTLFMLISIACFGFLTIASAKDVSVALIGNVLTYVGGCFLPYCFLLCICELCQTPVKRWLSLLLFAGNLSVFSLVWSSIGGATAYYADTDLIQMNGVSVLLTQMGPMRNVFEILIIIDAVAAVVVVLLSFYSNKNISYKTSWMLIALELFTMVVYAVERKTEHMIDWVCVSYIVDEFILLVLIYRVGKYDVSESIACSINGQEDYAYMIFDMKLNYLGCSPMLKKHFPDVTHVKVDRPIDPMGNAVMEKAVAWLNSSVVTGMKNPLYLNQNGRDLKCTWRPINNGLFGKQSGYLVEIFDDTKQQKYLQLISNYNAQLEGEVEAKLEHIQEMQDQIIIGISDIVESRDNSTGGHVKRTSEAVRIFIEELAKESKEFHMTKKYCENIIKAAPMHDLGKIAVEDYILKKPGRFTEDEYQLMKVHAAVGAQIVEKALNGVENDAFMEVAKNMARYHHEKWDGKGYPEGLSGEKIPLEARIMALADVFDALVSKRCYKERYNYEDAFQIIEDSLGTHFDPELGRSFLKCREELEAYYDKVEEE